MNQIVGKVTLELRQIINPALFDFAERKDGRAFPSRSGLTATDTLDLPAVHWPTLNEWGIPQ